MTILDNVRAWLAHYEIDGLKFDEENALPDRVFAFDTQGQLIKYCASRREHFSVSTKATMHGPSARLSFRERKRPSLQVVVHEISAKSPHAWDYCFVELDFDKANPQQNLGTLLIHGTEVIDNSITGKKTDQDMIALRLRRRGIAPIAV